MLKIYHAFKKVASEQLWMVTHQSIAGDGRGAAAGLFATGTSWVEFEKDAPGTPMTLAPLVYTIRERATQFDPQDPQRDFHRGKQVYTYPTYLLLHRDLNRAVCGH